MLLVCRFIEERHIVRLLMPHNFRSFTCSSNVLLNNYCLTFLSKMRLGMFINRYGPIRGVILVWHNFSIIPPAKHNYFEHNTLVSWETPKSIILYFSSIIRQTLATLLSKGSFVTLQDGKIVHRKYLSGNTA